MSNCGYVLEPRALGIFVVAEEDLDLGCEAFADHRVFQEGLLRGAGGDGGQGAAGFTGGEHRETTLSATDFEDVVSLLDDVTEQRRKDSKTKRSLTIGKIPTSRHEVFIFVVFKYSRTLARFRQYKKAEVVLQLVTLLHSTTSRA